MVVAVASVVFLDRGGCGVGDGRLWCAFAVQFKSVAIVGIATTELRAIEHVPEIAHTNTKHLNLSCLDCHNLKEAALVTPACLVFVTTLPPLLV